MTVLREFFEKDNFREEYVESRTVRYHYAFIECDECVTWFDKVNKHLSADGGRMLWRLRHLSLFSPAYWLESHHGQVRASFGTVGVSPTYALNPSMKVFREANSKLGGGKRPYTNFGIEAMGEEHERMWEHYHSHYDADVLYDLTMGACADAPAGTNGWVYVKFW